MSPRLQLGAPVLRQNRRITTKEQQKFLFDYDMRKKKADPMSRDLLKTQIIANGIIVSSLSILSKSLRNHDKNCSQFKKRNNLLSRVKIPHFGDVMLSHDDAI